MGYGLKRHEITPALQRALDDVLRQQQERIRTGRNPQHWGTNMWAELHTFMLGLDEPINPARVLAYLSDFNARIPECQGCRRRWDAFCAATPPRVTSAWDAFCWSVDAHNDVNHSFAQPKKRWTYAEAQARWRRQPAPAPAADHRKDVKASNGCNCT